MNHSFVKEFKNLILKEHLKRNTVSADNTIKKICYLSEIENLCEETSSFCQKWFQDIFQFELVKDIIFNQGDFQEIIVHNCQHCQKDKAPVKFSLNWDNESIFQAFQFFCDSCNINWNSNNQFVSFHSFVGGHSFRFTLIHPSLNPDGVAKIFIRSHSKKGLSVEDFTDNDTAAMLRALISQKKNIIIAGSTGSGKTSLLNSLLNDIGTEDHIVVIEDAGEIQLKNDSTSYLVSSNSEQLKEFCSYALRMSPDRIVLGEIRSREVIPFILSSNTGHKGMMSTIHANSAVDSLSRLSVLFSLFSSSEMQYQSIERLIHKSVEYVVYLDKKRIVEIIKIVGFDNNKTIFDLLYSSADTSSLEEQKSSLQILESCFS